MLEMLHDLEDVYKNDSGGNQIQVHCDALHKEVPNKKALLSLNKCSQFHFCSFLFTVFRVKKITLLMYFSSFIQ